MCALARMRAAARASAMALLCALLCMGGRGQGGRGVIAAKTKKGGRGGKTAGRVAGASPACAGAETAREAKAAAERFLADGDREQQRQCWSRAAELDDDDAEPLVRLGNLLHADGLPEQALRLLERARAMAPANAHVHASLGSAAYSMGGGSPAHFRAAVAHYEQAAALAGGLTVHNLNNLGISYAAVKV